jgi:hypothetical protein
MESEKLFGKELVSHQKEDVMSKCAIDKLSFDIAQKIAHLSFAINGQFENSLSCCTKRQE